MPDDVTEGGQLVRRPGGADAVVGPDDDPAVLGAAGDQLALQTDRGRPGHVPHPVRVGVQLGLLHPLVLLLPGTSRVQFRSPRQYRRVVRGSQDDVAVFGRAD